MKKIELIEQLNESRARIFLAHQAKNRLLTYLESSKFHADPTVQCADVSTRLKQGMHEALDRHFMKACGAKIVFNESRHEDSLPYVELPAEVKINRVVFTANHEERSFRIPAVITYTSDNWPIDGSYSTPYATGDTYGTVQTIRITLEMAIEHGLI